MSTYVAWFTNLVLDYTLPPLGLGLLALIWPPLVFLKTLGYLIQLPFSGRLKEKVVIITGASSGLGRYMAYEYAKRGAYVVVAARREEKLKQVVQDCKDFGAPDAMYVRADVSKQEDCNNIIDSTYRRYRRVDVLVNNAGLARSGLFEEYKNTQDFVPTVDVDVWGNIWPTLHALKHLKVSKGQVVVTASVAAYTTYPRQSLYNAAKSAVLQFYDTLRNEVRGQGADVAITIVMPGFVKSELTAGAPKGHIPWWWPMMSTEEAARVIVSHAAARTRYVIVPFWYVAWLPYRLFAYDFSDWVQRLLILGRPPTKVADQVVVSLCGEDKAQHLFEKFSAVKEA